MAFGSGPIPSTAAESNNLEVQGQLDASRPQTILHLGNGRSVALPTELLLAGAGAHMERPFAESQVVPAGQEVVIPLVAEQMEVSKRTVETGRVRLHRSTETYQDTASLDLTRTGWQVERVPVGELVAERPEVRQEGDRTVYPVIEERLVARREYFLLEEVHVRQVATTTPRTATLELKRDVLTVERTGSGLAEDGPEQPSR